MLTRSSTTPLAQRLAHLLPEIALGAVRNSPSINDDTLMDLFRFLADPPNADED
jgi:uncharacterized protein (DUF2336 family)